MSETNSENRLAQAIDYLIEQLKIPSLYKFWQLAGITTNMPHWYTRYNSAKTPQVSTESINSIVQNLSTSGYKLTSEQETKFYRLLGELQLSNNTHKSSGEIISKRVAEPRTKKRLKVFLCHSPLDNAKVGELYQKLIVDGFEPWLDEEDLLPGQTLEIEIRKAIRNANVVLICLSHKSVNKPSYVNREIKFALDIAEEQPENSIFIIPVKLEECDIPQRLNHLQRANLFEERGYEKLVKALNARAKATEL